MARNHAGGRKGGREGKDVPGRGKEGKEGGQGRVRQREGRKGGREGKDVPGRGKERREGERARTYLYVLSHSKIIVPGRCTVMSPLTGSW